MRGLMTSPWSSMWASGTGNIIPASILRWMTDLRWQLAGPVYRHVENMSEQLVCESVEGSFDAEEFVDGAKSAGEKAWIITLVVVASVGKQTANSFSNPRTQVSDVRQQSSDGCTPVQN